MSLVRDIGVAVAGGFIVYGISRAVVYARDSYALPAKAPDPTSMTKTDAGIAVDKAKETAKSVYTANSGSLEATPPVPSPVPYDPGQSLWSYHGPSLQVSSEQVQLPNGTIAWRHRLGSLELFRNSNAKILYDARGEVWGTYVTSLREAWLSQGVWPGGRYYLRVLSFPDQGGFPMYDADTGQIVGYVDGNRFTRASEPIIGAHGGDGDDVGVHP